MSSLVIPKSLFEKAKEYLFQDKNERFAFFFCGVSKSNQGVTFLAKELSCITDSEVVSSPAGIQLKLDAILRITNHAVSMKLGIVEAHSHPWVKTPVHFSKVDTRGMEEFTDYVFDVLPGIPYGATVWGSDSIAGACWEGAKKKQIPISNIRVVGDSFTEFATTWHAGNHVKNFLIGKRLGKCSRYSRQVIAFGREGQEKISSLKVAIVGLGGIGSHVIQLLSYLGARDFLLIDDDIVEETNLNRLIGGKASDIGRSKVEVMRRIPTSILGRENVKIVALKQNLRKNESLYSLKNSDIVFGCVDNDGARLILNELCVAYMIPYIDCAFGINTEKGKIVEAGGRVMVVHPDGPCLLCAKEIGVRAAQEDLASPEERRRMKELGYISNVNIPSPSVVSLNGAIACAAVTEFLALATGFRPVQVFTWYDIYYQGKEHRMGCRIVQPNPKCVTCSIRGDGDKVRIGRYATS